MVDSFFDSLPDRLNLIMGLVPTLITIAVPVAIILAYYRVKKETARARETAVRLSLGYINVAGEAMGGKKDGSFISKIFSGWSPWAMEGEFDGVKVRVELVTSAKRHRVIQSSTRLSESNPTRTSYATWTSYDAFFSEPLPFDVFIHRRIRMGFGFPSPGGADAIATGDAELDGMMSISGSDSSRILEWLNSGQRKEALIKLFKASPSVSIDSNKILLQDLYKKADHSHIRSNLTLLADAAKRLK